MRDWRPDIVRLVEIKQAIDDADVERLWEFHLPRVAATEEELSDTEVAIGTRLDPEYREFLGYANGWPSFFHTIDLFGTDDLTGSARLDIAIQKLDAVEPVVYEQSGLQRDALVPVASTTEDLDLFVMPVSDGQQWPPVVWLAGDEVERFASFGEFVDAMIEYNVRELATLTGK
jgi:hypothetical protein